MAALFHEFSRQKALKIFGQYHTQNSHCDTHSSWGCVAFLSGCAAASKTVSDPTSLPPFLVHSVVISEFSVRWFKSNTLWLIWIYSKNRQKSSNIINGRSLKPSLSMKILFIITLLSNFVVNFLVNFLVIFIEGSI